LSSCTSKPLIQLKVSNLSFSPPKLTCFFASITFQYAFLFLLKIKVCERILTFLL
jgi:hypothetical protein